MPFLEQLRFGHYKLLNSIRSVFKTQSMSSYHNLQILYTHILTQNE
uniref:Uncharacterized protein n=1 Tax=Arundo donax TaxID=35708 RepID=A0A0A9DVF9_ARUDO